uniref:acetylcholine receptor subunit epsilon isoform X2 n=1 Tax=Pristiophorus japonicus TaxID=55135 RepID=UPI00398F0419
MALPLLLILCLVFEASSNEEGKVFDKLMTNYDKRIRPAKFYGDIIDVTLKLTLTNLISLNEKEETLTTNVWVEIQWNDYRLAWNKSEYDGIDLVRIPSDMVWLPEIVLENKSQAYSAREINLELTEDEGKVIEWIHTDPGDFTENGEWTIKHKPAKKNFNRQFTVDDIEYQEIIFFLIIQRKPLFYIINIIAPCVLISSLVVLVYFLPAQAGGQKCTLSVSVLLAQTIFLFLIAQKIPETSLNVPLIGKYLMFAMVVSTLIVTNCVIVLNVSLRTPNTHSMSEKVKHMFLEILPQYLGMHLESSEDSWDTPQPRRRSSFGIMIKAEEYILKKPRSELMFERQRDRHGLKRADKMAEDIDIGTTVDLYKNLAHFAPEIKTCVDACNFIAESTKEQNDIGSENENWILIGKVIDKACFWIALLLIAIGTLVIFLMGHFNQAPEFPFAGDRKKYAPE